MHTLLARQLRRLELDEASLPPKLRELLDRVSRTYTQSDQDRYTLERSLMISSREMQALYAEQERAAAASLERSNALGIAIEEAVLDGIVVTDDRFAVMRYNTRYLEIFGQKPNPDVPGEVGLAKLSQLMVDPAAFLARVRAIAADPDVRSFEELRFRDGRVVERYSTPIRTTRGFLGRLWCFRDVSEARRLDAERMLVAERMASMGRLVASVAHEINNPLAFVCANMEHLATLVAKEGGADADEVLADTRAGLERIRVIVRDLRKASRGDEERLAPLDVERALESALHMAMNEIRHRAILLRKYDGPPAVRANETRLVQVFLNLLMNAAHALPEGRASQNAITISTRTDEHGYACVEIADTGCGIPPENVTRIFDPFFTTKPIGSGSGLGLAICRGIIENHGGTIVVESTVGRGTRFTVRLPPAPPRRSTRPSAHAPSTRSVRTRVLLIDDEPAIRRAIVRTLRDHEVVACEGVREAILQLEQGSRFDVILCDVMMPDLTGMDFHALLGNVAPEQLSRLVFLSGGTFSPAMVKFFEEVKNEQVDKPFTTKELRAVIARVAGRE